MNWIDQSKQLLREGFEEILRNPALLQEVVEETIEDVDTLVESSKPVIKALLTLIDVVGQMKLGNGSRALHKPSLHVAGMRLADKIDVPEEVE